VDVPTLVFILLAKMLYPQWCVGRYSYNVKSVCPAKDTIFADKGSAVNI